MKQKVTNMFHTIKSAFHRRSYFFRLLITTMIAAFIPLSFQCMRLIKQEVNTAYNERVIQLENATNMAAAQFEDMIASMDSVSIKMVTNADLFEDVISKTISSEINAINIIEKYLVAVPFVQDLGLYNTDTGIAYTNWGKMKKNGLAIACLGLPEERLDPLFSSTLKSSFLPWEDTQPNLIYIVPMNKYSKSSRINQFGIYRITMPFLLEQMQSILVDSYILVSIETPRGDFIFNNPAITEDIHITGTDDYIVSSARSKHSYQITLCTSKASFRHSIDSISKRAYSLVWLNICLCVILIIAVIIYNYRPVSNAVKQISADRDIDDDIPELDTILQSYSQLKSEKGQLNIELYEKNLYLTDKLIENLLRGQKLTRNEWGQLHLNMPYYRVVCAPLNKVHNICGIIEHNRIGTPVYAIEMYSDFRMVFVCGLPDESNEALNVMKETINALLDHAEIPLGISKAYNSRDMIFMAYLEAGMNLNDKPADNDRAAKSDPFLLLFDSNNDTDKLIRAIQSGDDYVIRFAEEAFDCIARTGNDSERKYKCYQLIELYRRSMQMTGMQLNMEPLTLILNSGDERTLRDELLAQISGCISRKQSELSDSKDAMFSNVIQCISDNFTDCLFGLNELAEKLGVSVYTASRMVKNITGITFKKYLTDMRIERSKDLLRSSNLSINEIAEKSGFSSPSYFISVFKNSEGMTPSKYRGNA